MTQTPRRLILSFTSSETRPDSDICVLDDRNYFSAGLAFFDDLGNLALHFGLHFGEGFRVVRVLVAQLLLRFANGFGQILNFKRIDSLVSEGEIGLTTFLISRCLSN